MKPAYYFYLFIFLFIININAQYIPDWIQTYPTGQSPFYNYGDNTVLDQHNNIYVGGHYYPDISQSDAVIYKFSSAGQFQWSKTYSGYNSDNNASIRKIMISPSGYVYVIGIYENTNNFTGRNFIYKYDLNGNLSASTIYYRYQNAYAAAVYAAFDNNYNIVLTGVTGNFLQSNDSVLTVKYDQNLNLLWSNTYAERQSLYNMSRAIKTDSQGNIFVAGQLNLATYNNDIAVFKYTSAGVLSWVQKYHYNNSGIEESAFDIGLDNNQNVLVTGYTRVINGNDSAATIALKYSGAGSLLWSNMYNTTPFGFESGYKILYNGNFYIQTNGDYGISVFKIDNGGNLTWNTPVTGNIRFCSLDNSGNIMLTGYRNGSGFNPFTLVRMTQNGVIDQIFNYSVNNTGTDLGFYLRKFSDSEILAVGQHNNDILMLKLRPPVTNNITINRNNLNKPIIDNQYTYDTIFFSPGDLPANTIIKDVNVTLDTILHPADFDLVISLSHLNITDSLSVRRGGPTPNYIGTHLNDSASTNICEYTIAPFTGSFKPCLPLSKFNLYPAEGAWILKILDVRANNIGTLKAWKLNITYDAPPIGINPVSTEVPDKFSLSQNYPNPFNPATHIGFRIAKSGPVKIIIYNSLGKELETVVNENLQPGTYEVEWNAENYPSGVYFYKLTAWDPSLRSGQGFTESKKMILVK